MNRRSFIGGAIAAAVAAVLPKKTFASGGIIPNRTYLVGETPSFESVPFPLPDVQMIESRKFDRDQIAAIFRLPPHLIVDEPSTYGACQRA
jgi:phage portal protein BeeE